MMFHKDETLTNYPDWEVPFMQRMSRMIARDRNYSANRDLVHGQRVGLRQALRNSV